MDIRDFNLTESEWQEIAPWAYLRNPLRVAFQIEKEIDKLKEKEDFLRKLIIKIEKQAEEQQGD